VGTVKGTLRVTRDAADAKEETISHTHARIEIETLDVQSSYLSQHWSCARAGRTPPEGRTCVLVASGMSFRKPWKDGRAFRHPNDSHQDSICGRWWVVVGAWWWWWIYSDFGYTLVDLRSQSDPIPFRVYPRSMPIIGMFAGCGFLRLPRPLTGSCAMCRHWLRLRLRCGRRTSICPI
jgi:hypothetical protein